MSDQHINCSECGGSFVFTESERQFYETKGLSGPPKRCKTCRQARKAADPGRSGGFRAGREGGGAPRGGAPFRPSEGRGGGYDRPRGGPPGPGGPPARGGWGRVGGDAPRAGGFGGQAGGGGFSDRGPARGNNGFAPRGGGDRGFGGPPRGDGAGPRYGADRGFSGAPRGDQTRGDGARPARPERPRFGEGAGRREIRTDVGPKPRPAPAEAAPPRPKKAKPERPKFDVTCIECGTAAQVPFKPIEGRDVFCQPCYRARRGIAEPATAGAPPAPETSPDASESAPVGMGDPATDADSSDSATGSAE